MDSPVDGDDGEKVIRLGHCERQNYLSTIRLKRFSEKSFKDEENNGNQRILMAKSPNLTRFNLPDE